ncbi:disease susceptibility protein LOV1-like [Salvia hispanica]|uniref:disease susceptibility protein LOV1-like n=1 Tax=Salvia hispanica TaxID=49212 RepID=UPI0020095138|nr:disease susceptibility protein LOV1-like [Salvia hispanica]
MEVELLKEDDAWDLLKKKTFPPDINPEFVREESTCTLGKQMAKKCGYLPLAISLLGGVWSERNSTREWELVNENMDAYLYNIGDGDGNESKLEAVVNLSYDDLPYHLKLCFLYLGVLRDGESMAAVDLYRMWISQGMISEENSDKSPMELAEDYLRQLVSKSIVQAKRKDARHRTKFTSCNLHCVVRKLCLSMGKKEHYQVQTLEYTGGRFSSFLDHALSRVKTRHLVIHFKAELQEDDGECNDQLGKEDSCKHLRSLHLHNDITGRVNIELPSTVDFRRFKSLRSLAFEGFKFVRGKLPRGVTRLVHLRNLRFRKCELDELQSSISNLVYLEILDYLISKNTKIPNVLKKMVRLKQLLLPRYDRERIGDYRLKLDKGLDQLEALQGLNSLVHENSCYTRMKKLQRFSAYVFDKESYTAIMNAIDSNWERLVYTYIVVEEGWEFTSTNLNQAFTCRNLTDLVIYAHLGRLLTECWSNIICSNIAILCLNKCKIEEDPLEVLGNLASLKRLCFHLGSFIGERMRCPASSFPCLQVFELNDLQELREWKVDEGAMPLLLHLYIRRCLGMEMVPQGLIAMSNLQDLIIEGMPELGRRVMSDNGGREGEDFHKVRHVSKITIK